MLEVSAPLRLTWDLPAAPNTAIHLWEAMARDRVLFVEIAVREGREAALSAIAPELCSEGAPRVTLAATVSAAAASLEALGVACAAKLDLLLLPPHRAETEATLAGVYRSVVRAIWSTAAGIGEFAAALRLARRAGGGTVAILNPPAPAAPLTPSERREAAVVWDRDGGPEVGLRIHDLFLARELGLEPFREYGGCQAGNSLAHVDSAGKATACRTLPVQLGDLDRQTLHEIWRGEARRNLRRVLDAVPAECAGCVVAERCRGGCRGFLPGAAESDLERRDPSCPGQLNSAEAEHRCR